MTVGELFAGIGGFGLGFRCAGFEISWQVEIDVWCRRVLDKNFPESKKYGDIRSVGRENLSTVDVITGGFPCQPFSSAGKRSGAEDDRYLWPEMLRVIREIQPTWIVAENVYALTLGRMEPIFETVSSDLEASGYSVQTFGIPACGVDARHIRQRAWIVAHFDGFRCGEHGRDGQSSLPHRNGKCTQEERERNELEHGAVRDDAGFTHSDRQGLAVRQSIRGDDEQKCTPPERSIDQLSHASGEPARGARQSWEDARRTERWTTEPEVVRVLHGVPYRVVQPEIRGLGNAIVPQIAYVIACAIMETEHIEAMKRAA